MKSSQNRIKQLRNEHIPKLTQENLANEIGVSKLTISRWENEEVQIKPDKAKQLADYFGVPVGYLLGYDVVLKSIENKTDGDELLSVGDELLSILNQMKWQQHELIDLSFIDSKDEAEELKTDVKIAIEFLNNIIKAISKGDTANTKEYTKRLYQDVEFLNDIYFELCSMFQ